jgi:hypothetical protein
VSVLVAKISQSPWPELVGECDGGDDKHPAIWVVWTEQDTGDGMRFACGTHLGGWVEAVWDRIDGNNADPESW